MYSLQALISPIILGRIADIDDEITAKVSLFTVHGSSGRLSKYLVSHVEHLLSNQLSNQLVNQLSNQLPRRNERSSKDSKCQGILTRRKKGGISLGSPVTGLRMLETNYGMAGPLVDTVYHPSTACGVSEVATEPRS